MIAFARFIALVAAALFAGAALYINWAEQPARLRLDTRHAVRQWAPSYQRATLMQAPLAVASCLAGVVAWLLGSGDGWLVAAVLIGSVVPFTLVGVMPTNRRLLSPALDPDSSEARALLVRWGRLHAVRTALSLAATVLDAWLVA